MVLREVVGKTASQLVFGLGFLVIAWDTAKQGWHDRIAGTVVLDTRFASAPAAHLPAASKASDHPFRLLLQNGGITNTDRETFELLRSLSEDARPYRALINYHTAKHASLERAMAALDGTLDALDESGKSIAASLMYQYEASIHKGALMERSTGLVFCDIGYMTALSLKGSSKHVKDVTVFNVFQAVTLNIVRSIAAERLQDAEGASRPANSEQAPRAAGKEVALPESALLYVRNAFRVLGASTRSEIGELYRRMSDGVNCLRADLPLPYSITSLPYELPPTEEVLQSAFERAQDAPTRLEEELFWIWSDEPDTQPSQATDLESLEQAVNNPPRETGPWHAHDVAVIAHADALSSEMAFGLSPDVKGKWRAAMNLWARALEDGSLLDHLRTRAFESGEPCLDEECAWGLNEIAPELILGVNLSIARVALSARKTGYAKFHLGLVRDSGLAGTTTEEQWRKFLAEVMQDVKDSIRLFPENLSADELRDVVESEIPVVSVIREAASTEELGDLGIIEFLKRGVGSYIDEACQELVDVAHSMRSPAQEAILRLNTVIAAVPQNLRMQTAPPMAQYQANMARVAIEEAIGNESRLAHIQDKANRLIDGVLPALQESREMCLSVGESTALDAFIGRLRSYRGIYQDIMPWLNEQLRVVIRLFCEGGN
jgi:hypothetical protein